MTRSECLRFRLKSSIASTSNVGSICWNCNRSGSWYCNGRANCGQQAFALFCEYWTAQTPTLLIRRRLDPILDLGVQLVYRVEPLFVILGVVELHHRFAADRRANADEGTDVVFR